MKESTTRCSASMNRPRAALWIWSEFERAFWMRLAVATMSSATCSAHEPGNLWESSSKNAVEQGGTIRVDQANSVFLGEHTFV